MKRTTVSLSAAGVILAFLCLDPATAQQLSLEAQRAQAGASREQIEAAKAYKRIEGPQTLNPGEWPQRWPYADEYDSAVAAAEVHHVRYVDSKIRLVEVAYFPGVRGQMHGHPYPSVFAFDSPTPKSTNVGLDPERLPSIGRAPSPKGMEYPFCQTMGPQSPHAESNLDTWPHHFFRLEFLRVDGDDILQHWREWYAPTRPPYVQRQPNGAPPAGPLSDAYRLLYEDDHVRLVEVTLRPGETEPMHADQYPAVIARDAPMPATTDHLANPASVANGQDEQHGAATAITPSLTCSTAGPRAPHALQNKGSFTVHLYRIEFKRIDGEGLRTQWRTWYPWIGAITDGYAQRPYVLNY